LLRDTANLISELPLMLERERAKPPSVFYLPNVSAFHRYVFQHGRTINNVEGLVVEWQKALTIDGDGIEAIFLERSFDHSFGDVRDVNVCRVVLGPGENIEYVGAILGPDIENSGRRVN
jgi:hypothetical protein